MKLKSNELVLFTRRLSDLIGGGLPLSRSLEVLARQSSDKKSRAMMVSVRNELEAGRSFTQALARQSGLFPDVYLGMIRSGESSGNLETTLNELAGLLETEVESRQRVRATLAYPLFLLILAGGVCVFLLGFVIPRFEFLFQDLGQQLPLPTRLLMGLSTLLRHAGPWLLIVFAGLGFYLFKHKTLWQDRLHNKLLQIPIVAQVWRGLTLEKWASLMSSLFRSGYTATDALQLSRQGTSNPFFKADLKIIFRRIIEGKSFHHALTGSPWFPPMICELIGAAEESGQLEAVFERIAQSAKRETEMHRKMLLSVLEPSLILGMGIVVGFVALAMLLPIFEMSASLR